MKFIDDLLVARASEDDQPNILACTSGTALDQYEYFTGKDFDRLTNKAAHVLRDRQIESSVVAILGTSNLEYLVNICALSRLGYTVLILSPRLSITAYTRLLEETSCTTLLYAPEYTETTERLSLPTALMLNRPDFDCDTHPPSRLSPPPQTPPTAFIMHSSGSTGFPKPIFHTHRRCLSNFQNGFGLSALITLPLYHTYGFSSFFRALHGRTLMYLFNWTVPMTEGNVVAMMKAARPELLSTVPYTLGLLGESEEGIEVLARCKMVTSHGSACPDELGDRLVGRGVYLVSHLGSTESGPLATSDRPPGDHAWNYLRFLPQVLPYMWMKPVDDSNKNTLYELVLLSGLKAKIFSNSDTPPDSFHSRDLFSPHPSILNAWKYEGRLDDRVTLTNGEKVLPLPIEGVVRQNSLVREAIVFGIGKAVPGLLVFRGSEGGEMSDEDFLEKIWPAIDIANSHAEGFSQIDRDMVVVIGKDTAYPATDKGSVIRAQAYEVFSGLIDQAYEQREKPEEGTWILSEEETAERIADFCTESLGLGLGSSEADLYSAGLDSLKAIKLSVFIRKNFDLGGKGSALTQNTIYESGSVNRLARLICELRTGGGLKPDDDDDISAINALIKNYSQFQRHDSTLAHNGLAQPVRYHVLLTGATGSLGAHLLAKLSQSPQVEAIYCLIRQKDASINATTRITSSLQERKLSLSEPALQKVTALYADPSHPSFGLESSTFNTLKTRTNLIINAAWPVNFNLGLSSFETQIAGLGNLIQFSLDVDQPQPAHLLFCSSISVASRSPAGQNVPESLITDFTHASKTGYARSKLVAEHILGKAMESGANCSVLRIGQIVGDSVHGIWTGVEAIPLIIRSAGVTGTLPELDETCAWIPVDTLADIILELSLTPSSSQPNIKLPLVYNLFNPHPFHWTRDLLPALKKSGISFKPLPPAEWVSALERSNPDPVRNPAIKLLLYFQYRYSQKNGSGAEGQAPPPPGFETENTLRYAPSLGVVPDLIESGIVERFVKTWEGMV